MRTINFNRVLDEEELLKDGLDEIFRKYYFDLKERVDKAIEYINDLDNCKNTYANGDRTITNDYIIKLLDILKGEDNE